MITLLLAACGTPSPAPNPAPPEPVEKAAEPAPEPASDTETVMLAFGVQCEPMPEGSPDSEDAVRTALEAAGVDVREITKMPTCKACNTCPLLAVEVTVAAGGQAKITETFPKAVAGP